MATASLEMKVQRQVSARAGDMAFTCKTDADGRVEGLVDVTFGSVGSERHHIWDASELERAAAALHQVRKELGDYRNVCAAHGYYTLDAGQNYDCPGCRAEAGEVLTMAAPAEASHDF